MSAKKVCVIDLFAGCGGLSLGFRQAGYEIRLAVESDEDAARTYSRNFPHAKVVRARAEDLSAAKIRELAKLGKSVPFVVVGGPPCQGFSTLRWGRRRDEDKRNRLVMVFAQLVDDLSPDAWLLENVPTIQSHESFEDYLDYFAGDYEIHGPKILDAVDFGVPQIRKRLFVIGVRAGVTFQFPENRFNNGHRKTVREALEGLPSPQVWNRGEDPRDGGVANHQKSRHSEIAISRLSAIDAGESHLDLPEELRLDCHKRASDEYGAKVYREVYGRMHPDEPAPTITSGCINVTRGRFGHPFEPRAITPREAARLQSFPDYFGFYGGRESIALQIGNAVPVRLAKRLAYRFKFPGSQRGGGQLELTGEGSS